MIRSGTVGWLAGCATVSTWDTVSINKGESILTDDTLVKVWCKTDLTGLMAISAFLCTVRSHPLVTTATSSISLVVGVCYTVLALVSSWSVATVACWSTWSTIDATVISCPPLGADTFLIKTEFGIVVTYGILNTAVTVVCAWSVAAVSTFAITFTIVV